MTDIEKFQREIQLCENNLKFAIKRNAPEKDMENIKKKIALYEKVIQALKEYEYVHK